VDQQDRRILAKLQVDGRLTNQQLADETNMSTSACWRRVRLLEETGFIRRYTALIDRRKAGFAVLSIVHVQLARHEASQQKTFIKRINERPEVLECLSTTGEADYHLRVVAADMDAYNRFLNDFLFRLPGISHVRSNLVLEEIKTDVSLPL
jgi:Lrp/AsnC family leucine-responsive transcriptional regulator